LNSILNISNGVNSGEDFYLLLGDFLDEYYSASLDAKAEMLFNAPEDMESPELVPFLAASAHKLADDYGLEPHRWAFEPRCYLPGMSPFFGCKAKGRLRLWFMYKSPAEFKHRNLFVDENVLARV
jgi:hypothetical protein